MSSSGPFSRRGLLSGAAAAAAGAVLGGGRAGASTQPAGSRPAEGDNGPSGPVRPFPLENVRLRAGPFRAAQERNSHYLLSLPQDRLLHTFRINAGIRSAAEPLGGWEKPDCELRGHFVGGHYLSACALGYASTGDEDFRRRAAMMVAELARCQKAHKNGYLSAFPEEFFDRLRDGVKVWAPFYTIHKILAGHLHVYEHCGSEEALATAEGMAGWVYSWTKGLSDAQMERILLVEYGGMNDVLYKLSALTGKEEYRYLAHRFDQRAFFEPLARRRDELQGLHVNTQIPKIVGAARRYELTGEERYRQIAEYFWGEITRARSYCTGNTSNGEHWNTPPGVLSTELSASTAECCCAYNMLKLTRHLFSWTADPAAADYYERTLWNSRLGTQNPDDATLMYYYPLASGYWKFFGDPLRAFWCCTGTGVEEHAKFGDSIYFRDDAGVFVNLFIASELTWPEKGLRLVQETSFPEEAGTALVVQADRPVELTLRLRIPGWARGGRARLNGEALEAFASPSSYLILRRVWKNGDRIELELPMSLWAWPMPDDESVAAVMYGPLVLAGKLGDGGLTRQMMYGQYDCELQGAPVAAPPIAGDLRRPESWVEAVAGEPLSFRARGERGPIALVPLDRLFGERYAVYWKAKKS
jgi:uncharacterized protein